MGGGARAQKVIDRARRHIIRTAGVPRTSLSVFARLTLVGAVATAPSLLVDLVAPQQNPAVRQAAAVTPHPIITDEPSAGSGFPASSILPLPPGVVGEPGPLNIPTMALTAYRNAERLMARAMPDCGVSWNLLAGIGRIESRHAFGGETDSRGNPVKPIFGPALDGSLPGNEIIVQGHADGRTIYARAMGPMQFLPGTWAHYGADADGDGQANPQNLFDSTLAAARYLCDGGLDLRDRPQLITAVMRYNNSMAYTLNVLGWANGYVTGVVPVNLPPITAPARPRSYAPVATNTTGASSDATGSDTADQGLTGNTGSSYNRSSSGPTGSSSRTSSPPASSSSGSGGTSAGRGGTAGASGSSSGSAPRVKIGNGRTGGARDTLP